MVLNSLQEILVILKIKVIPKFQLKIKNVLWQRNMCKIISMSVKTTVRLKLHKRCRKKDIERNVQIKISKYSSFILFLAYVY